MEISEKARVRQYRKSFLPRLRWTSELHDHFVRAVRNLGGKYDNDLIEATPKRIMQVMAVKGRKVSHIKSHLQMYRNMKEPTNLKEFLCVKNYQEHKSISDTLNAYPNWFPQRQVCTGVKEAAPHHTSHFKAPLICQGKRTTNQNGQHIFFHNINHKDTQGSRRQIPHNCREFFRSKVEIQAIGNNQVSESSKHSPINLDLTM